MKKNILMAFAVILTGSSVFVWLGVYNIAATDKHWAVTTELLELIKERSIEARAEDIAVPNNLDDPAGITSAAQNYEEMCSVCHLAPGAEATELHEGLYPEPPVFFESDHVTHDVRGNFWVIKNGVKLTGMPAWGASHNDEEIWGLVAFISKLKGMSAEEYQNITASEENHHADGQQDTH